MARIIAGRFPSRTVADAAAASMAHYVEADDLCVFHNNPPGQHDAYPVGGDEAEDPSADGAGASVAGGALAAGLTAGAIGAAGGPVTAIAAAAVGAYAGSVAGAMTGLDEDDAGQKPLRRPGGVFLAVRIAKPEHEANVIAALRSYGAADIEQAEGEWRDGDWLDFDPVAPPRLVGSAASIEKGSLQ